MTYEDVTPQEDTMRKCLIILFLVVSLVSCAHRTVPKENLDAIKRIAVLSLIGDKIQFLQIGTTVFDNVENYHSVKEWGIDNYIEGLMKNELAAMGQFKVLDVEFNRKKMYGIYRAATRLRWDHDIGNVEEYLGELASFNSVDALILVARRYIELEYPHRMVGGYTLYHRSFLGIKITTRIYLTLVVEVVDLRTIKSLARRGIFIEKAINNSYWQEEIEDLTDDQVLFIKNTIFDKLREAVPMAVKRIMNKSD